MILCANTPCDETTHNSPVIHTHYNSIRYIEWVTRVNGARCLTARHTRENATFNFTPTSSATCGSATSEFLYPPPLTTGLEADFCSEGGAPSVFYFEGSMGS